MHPLDLTVDELTSKGLVAANVVAMKITDFVALFFCVLIVAFKVVAELKDIELCCVAIRRSRANLSLGWHFVLMLIMGMRRWTFLPCLTVVVPMLVMLNVRAPKLIILRDSSVLI